MSFRPRIKYGVNSSRATEGRRSERSPAPHGVQGEASEHIQSFQQRLDAPGSNTGQVPQARHDEKTDFMDRHYLNDFNILPFVRFVKREFVKNCIKSLTSLDVCFMFYDNFPDPPKKWGLC